MSQLLSAVPRQLLRRRIWSLISWSALFSFPPLLLSARKQPNNWNMLTSFQCLKYYLVWVWQRVSWLTKSYQEFDESQKNVRHLGRKQRCLSRYARIYIILTLWSDLAWECGSGSSNDKNKDRNFSWDWRSFQRKILFLGMLHLRTMVNKNTSFT